jgi:hypothetical protein
VRKFTGRDCAPLKLTDGLGIEPTRKYFFLSQVRQKVLERGLPNGLDKYATEVEQKYPVVSHARGV